MAYSKLYSNAVDGNLQFASVCFSHENMLIMPRLFVACLSEQCRGRLSLTSTTELCQVRGATTEMGITPNWAMCNLGRAKTSINKRKSKVVSYSVRYDSASDIRYDSLQTKVQQNKMGITLIRTLSDEQLSQHLP